MSIYKLEKAKEIESEVMKMMYNLIGKSSIDRREAYWKAAEFVKNFYDPELSTEDFVKKFKTAFQVESVKQKRQNHPVQEPLIEEEELERRYKGTTTGLVRELAEIFGFVPSDEMMAFIIGDKKRNLGTSRYYLNKKEGYEFTQNEYGYDVVDGESIKREREKAELQSEIETLAQQLEALKSKLNGIDNSERE